MISHSCLYYLIPSPVFPRSEIADGPEAIGVKRVMTFGDVTLIYRTENEGMDVASHNITLSYMKHLGRLWWVRTSSYVHWF